MTEMPQTMYDHYMTVYEHMKAKAIAEDIDGKMALVYTGFLSRVVTGELKMPVPYYTYIVRTLEASKMAIQVRRGAGRTPSRWIITNNLATRAQIEAFLKSTTITSKPQGRYAALEQRIQDLTLRIDRLERLMNIMVPAVEELQKQMGYIETKIDMSGMNI